MTNKKTHFFNAWLYFGYTKIQKPLFIAIYKGLYLVTSTKEEAFSSLFFIFSKHPLTLYFTRDYSILKCFFRKLKYFLRGYILAILWLYNGYTNI
jgi:hypothetical protein